MKIEEIKPLNTQPETKQEKQDATPEIDCDKPADVISELSVIEEDPATDYDQTLIAECGNDLTENTLKKEQDDTDNDTSINISILNISFSKTASGFWMTGRNMSFGFYFFCLFCSRHFSFINNRFGFFR